MLYHLSVCLPLCLLVWSFTYFFSMIIWLCLFVSICHLSKFLQWFYMFFFLSPMDVRLLTLNLEWTFFFFFSQAEEWHVVTCQNLYRTGSPIRVVWREVWIVINVCIPSLKACLGWKKKKHQVYWVLTYRANKTFIRRATFSSEKQWNQTIVDNSRRSTWKKYSNIGIENLMRYSISSR